MQDLQLLVEQLHSQVVQRSQRCIQQRQPLVRKAAKRVADVKQYTPQFEEEYVAGKDYDPDRCACFHVSTTAAQHKACFGC